MVFSPGQNGKDKKTTCVQNGKRKGFSKRQKAGDKNRKSPSFNKQRTIVQPSVKRNEYRIALKKERLTHHQVPRSPQRRSRIEAAEEVVPAEEVGLPHTVSLVTEPLSSVSLVTEELMPRELRTSKGASAQYVPVITARRLQPNEVPHDDFGTVNNKPL